VAGRRGASGDSEVRRQLGGSPSPEGRFHHHFELYSDAHSYVRGIERKIVLIDRPMLADLMIDHKVGVTTAHTYVAPKVDRD
jgi:restriction endonuclease Mrr